MEYLMQKIMILLVTIPLYSLAVEIPLVRQVASKYNVSCILVFGDSSVDSGNNNVLHTTMKSNFLPYGKNFFDSRPTGRFSNGRLATDFVAEAVGYRKVIPPFLDPNLKPEDLEYGVSFASAATGFDDYTAEVSNVLSVSKQLEYFAHYKIHLRRKVGEERAEFITRNALYIISMGTNDFLQNYFLEPTRPKQFSLEEFENFLLSRFTKDVQEMHRLGARRLIIVGVLPLGCIPLIKTLRNAEGCDQSLNSVAHAFNAKLLHQLNVLKTKLGLRTALVDVYGMIQRAVTNPKQYGFVEGSKGCVGTGTIEYGDSCKGVNSCSDPDKYVFWDAVHPTQKMYKLIADEAIASFINDFF
ncbi:GDSL esterase/lipase At5g45950 [Vigna unguiculata]|uniref:Zeta-carotene desaturase n=1 Tax=Vigna unguiculata TaxID=3917 RepID=A0A4D6KK83_VIGUN|nr:GDSL esterase/lipase At5g45950 [Vigna unguiculata]QCD76823.1 zeta-carotene desaturase [Vigna unguiculata]